MALDTIYDERFYRVTTTGSLRAARVALKRLWEYGPFTSVIDVGCGVGAWLLAATELGAETICGVEGAHVPPSLLLVGPDCIIRRDLCQELHLDRVYDLCLCLEVAEHLPRERAESLVSDLIRLSSVVVFSGAIPFQGGDGHVNEIWPEYWAGLFRCRGYVPWFGLRESIWNEVDVPWWYRQNVVVFVKETEWSRVLKKEVVGDPMRVTAIHPESYIWNVHRPKGNLKTSWEGDLNGYYHCVRDHVAPDSVYGSEFPAPRPEDVS